MALAARDGGENDDYDRDDHDPQNEKVSDRGHVRDCARYGVGGWSENGRGDHVHARDRANDLYDHVRASGLYRGHASAVEQVARRPD